MSRPEHVRCENCCAWWHSRCHLHPKSVNKKPDSGCTEFSAEWPPRPVYDWDNPAHRPIIERMMHPLIKVTLTEDGDIETGDYVKALKKAYSGRNDAEDEPKATPTPTPTASDHTHGPLFTRGRKWKT